MSLARTKSKKSRPPDLSGNVALAAKIAEAQTAFVLAVKARLPHEAIRDLLAAGSDGVSAWVRRLRVDAPCMVEEAHSMLRLASSWKPGEPDDVEVDRRFRYPEPAVWCEELARFDALAPSRRLRDSMRPDELAVVAGDHLSRNSEVEIDVDRRISSVAAPLEVDVDFVAPIGANPLRETLEDFLQRARVHFSARCARLDQLAAGKRGPTGSLDAPTPSRAPTNDAASRSAVLRAELYAAGMNIVVADVERLADITRLQLIYAFEVQNPNGRRTEVMSAVEQRLKDLTGVALAAFVEPLPLLWPEEPPRAPEPENAAGFTVPTSSPELQRNVGWLLDFQMGGKSYAEIALAAQLTHAGGQTTVRMAIARVTELIGLKPRPVQRGRPPLA